eukprot:5538638-Pyramimonas_sp.AAC.1
MTHGTMIFSASMGMPVAAKAATRAAAPGAATAADMEIQVATCRPRCRRRTQPLQRRQQLAEAAAVEPEAA